MTFGERYTTANYMGWLKLSSSTYSTLKELYIFYAYPSKYVVFGNCLFEFVWDLKKETLSWKSMSINKNFGEEKFIPVTEKEAIILMM